MSIQIENFSKKIRESARTQFDFSGISQKTFISQQDFLFYY